MIKTHYNMKIKPTGKTNNDTKMICMYISDNKSKGSGVEKESNYKCDHYNKKDHTAYRDDKSFCRSLLANL